MSVILSPTLSCNFCTSAAMKTSCLVDRKPGLPLSLPPSSTDVRLEVEEAELGSGLVGSLVTSEPGVLVSTCTTADKVRAEHRRHQQIDCIWQYLIEELGVSRIELQGELPEAVSQRRHVDFIRPAFRQTGPQHLRHLQVEHGAGGHSKTFTEGGLETSRYLLVPGILGQRETKNKGPKQINQCLIRLLSCTRWRAHADDVKQGRGTLMGFP